MPREGLAREIHIQDDGLPVGMNDCYKFGMAWGCREDCPQLERGECEIYKDVEGFLKGEEKEES